MPDRILKLWLHADAVHVMDTEKTTPLSPQFASNRLEVYTASIHTPRTTSVLAGRRPVVQTNCSHLTWVLKMGLTIVSKLCCLAVVHTVPPLLDMEFHKVYDNASYRIILDIHQSLPTKAFRVGLPTRKAHSLIGTPRTKIPFHYELAGLAMVSYVSPRSAPGVGSFALL